MGFLPLACISIISFSISAYVKKIVKISYTETLFFTSIYTASFGLLFALYFNEVAAKVIPALLGLPLALYLKYYSFKKAFTVIKKRALFETLSKISEIYLQQITICILITLLTLEFTTNSALFLFCILFVPFHIPLFFYETRFLSLVLFLSSIPGSILFFIVYTAYPFGFLAAVSVHILFYIALDRLHSRLRLARYD
jgi:hypothetical protein